MRIASNALGAVMYQFHTDLLGTIRVSRTRCTTQIGYNVFSITRLPPSLELLNGNRTHLIDVCLHQLSLHIWYIAVPTGFEPVLRQVIGTDLSVTPISAFYHWTTEPYCCLSSCQQNLKTYLRTVRYSVWSFALPKPLRVCFRLPCVSLMTVFYFIRKKMNEFLLLL